MPDLQVTTSKGPGTVCSTGAPHGREHAGLNAAPVRRVENVSGSAERNPNLGHGEIEVLADDIMKTRCTNR